MQLPVGLHLSFWQTSWSDDLVPIIEKTRQAGFDVAEFPLLDADQMDFKRLRNALDVQGMKASCSTGLNQQQDLTSPDPIVRKEGLRYLRACLEGASVLGSPVLVGVTYAPWGYFPEDNGFQRRQTCIASLKEAAKIAEDNGVTLCLEVINRFEGYLLNTAAQGVALLEEVGSEWVKLHLDTFHMNIEEDSISAAIRTAGAGMGHLHCVANNRKPPGKGHIDWKSVHAAVQEIQYRGYVVGEVFVNPIGEVGRGMAIWRALEPDLMIAAKETAQFLKKEVANVDD